MKPLDKFIRYWRVKIALSHLPKTIENVFDIGCHDGYLLEKLLPMTNRQDGIDPQLTADTVSDSCELITGFFPVDIKEHQMQGVYQAIFALAVFEHFSDHDLRRSAAVIARMLSPEGRLIITVPHPFVDKILDMLILCRLIEGQAVEEHHSFDPKELLTYFSGYLRLARQERFQFGLNNVFIFEKL